MEVLQQSSLDIKRLLLKKTRYPKVRNFVVFYAWEDARVCLTEAFLWYAPQLSGTSILCFHILSFLRAQHREWVLSDGCYMARIIIPLKKVKDKSEKVGLKLNIQKTKIMASGLITSWQIDGEPSICGNSDRLYFGGLQNHCRWWLQPWN